MSQQRMGKVAAAVVGAVFALIGAWVLSTGGDLIYGVGLLVLGALFGVVAVREALRNRVH